MRQRIRHRLSNRHGLAAFAFLAAMCATPMDVAAQPAFSCAGLLPSASRAPAYARVSGEARCEGFFDGTVSQPFIELLSLLRQRPDALPPAAPNAPLLINAGSAAQIVIQPLAPSPFYRVDAALAAGQALRWNATPMLSSTGLRLTELGFLARDTASSVLRVRPVSLTTTPPAPDDPNLAYAVLRVSVAVASVAARSYQLGAGAGAGAVTGTASSTGWRPLPGTPLDAWDTLVLPVTLPSASAGPAADTHVDVRAVDTNGQLLPLLQFVVVGR